MRTLIVGGVALLSLLKTQAAIQLYENFGMLTNVPQLDVVSFANYGSFAVSSVLPYETVNTLNYTNTGRMTGLPGFRFGHMTLNGVRSPAANFFNGLDARIIGGGAVENSQIIVTATNIINRGHIHADGNGLVRLIGREVDLERSTVGIQPFTGGFGFVTETNFFPDVGIFDIYWGMDNEGNATLVQNSVVLAPTFAVQTPQHRVTNTLGGFATSLGLDNALGFALTNAVTTTNWLVQAVFVQTEDPEINVDVRFAPSTILTNDYRTAIVELSVLETNVLAGANFLNTIYLFDRMASETNFVLLTNLQTQVTFMPSNYEVTRVTPFDFIFGEGPNTTNIASIINYTDTRVTNTYSAYGFLVTNLMAVLPNVPGASLTNLPGRVEIVADDLNLARTRIRGEGLISVKSDNLSSTVNTVIDAQNLVFDLASASGHLQVRNLAKDMIDRTAGPVFCWSGIWTNTLEQVEDSGNTIPDPADPTQMIPEMVTNIVEIGFHVLVVDSRAVATKQPVFVAEFRANSTNLVISDTLRLVEAIEVDTEHLTITDTGRLLFVGNSIPDWRASNFRGVKTLLNEGLITMPGSAHFGADRPEPYVSIINRGQITAFNVLFRSQLFENSGSVESDSGPLGVGGITVEADTARLEGGTFTAGGDVHLRVTDLRMRNYTIETPQGFVLSATNSVADSGEPDDNLISSEGFHLLVKPRFGDLLGTTIESTAPQFLAVPHVWSADDRGPRREGFVNNVALGRVSLQGGFDSQFVFRGTNGNKALYIDFLELDPSVSSDIQNAISIAPNMIVYFADSNVPADQLDGLFADALAPDGRLRWVPDFAGPNSAVDVVLRSENRSVQMNRALRESDKIDSDGDGIVNKLDLFPLDPDGVQVTMGGVTSDPQSSIVSFSWEAQAGVTYVVEYATDLTAPDWKAVSEVTNTSKTAKAALFQEPIPPGTTQRYYRVRPR